MGGRDSGTEKILLHEQVSQDREEALSLLQATFESTADGLIVVNRDGRVLGHNQKFLQMWGMPEHLVSPQSDAAERFQYLANQTVDPEGFKAHILALFDQTPDAVICDQITLKDGRVFEWYSQPQRLKDEIVGRVWSYRDITQRQQTEAALRQGEEQFRRIVEHAKDITFLLDAEGNFVYTSPNLSQITGFTPQEVAGKPFAPFIHPDDLVLCEAVFHRVLSTGQDQEEIEFRTCHKAGYWIWQSASLACSQDGSGNPLVLGVTRPIEERKQREQALQLLVEGTASHTGEAFFQSCIGHMASLLKVDAVLIGKWADAHKCRVHTLSFLIEGQLRENFDYDLAGTPCELVVQGKPAYFAEGLVALFPNDPLLASERLDSYLGLPLVSSNGEVIGVIAVLNRGSLEFDPDREMFFRIFAARVGAELERQQAETALRQGEEQFRTLIENVPGAVYRCRSDEWWTMTFLSEAIADLTGYPAADFMNKPGRSLADLLTKSDVTAVNAVMRQAVDAHQPYVVEYPITHANGSERWMYEKGQGIFDDAGNLLWLDGVIVDITNRKRAEMLLTSQKQVLELIAADAPLDATLALLVSTFEKLAHCSTGSILLLDDSGQHLHHSIAPNLPEAYQQLVDGLEIGPAVGSCGTAAYRKAPVIVTDTQSDPLWSQWRDLARRFNLHSCWSMPIMSSQGTMMGTFALYFDRPQAPTADHWQILETAAHLAGIAMERKRTAEELYRAKEAAEMANRAKSQFLANMSHELRTPMNAILGFAQLMARDTSLSPQQQGALNVINTSGEHLLDLINDVLEMSKIEAGTITLSPHPFDLRHLLRTLQDMFQIQAEAKQLTLRFTLDDAVPRYIVGDEGKLRQVLINLLGNALKFTQVGHVALTVQAEAPTAAANGTLTFAIEDTGPGIPDEVLPLLFKPFVQAIHHVPGEGGSGLGLAITQQFVQLMGGAIAIATEVGQGSTFTFSIALEPVEPTALATLEDLSLQVATASDKTVQCLAPDQPVYRILVVDDRPENLDPLVQLLQSVGFDTRAAINGQDALNQWSTWHPHLIWMDMRMPIMDGYEATRQIRKREQGRGASENPAASAPSSISPALPTKIIALTASAFEDQREEMLAAGCDDFMHKPFHGEEIFRKMADHLGVAYVLSSPRERALPAARLGALSLETREGMPRSWLQDLSQAAIQADADWLKHLVDQMRPEQAELAKRLRDLVSRFEFEAIVEWVETVVHG
ncbi:MAG: PAS domain S-box protein [Leptolyngbya sp. SIO1E4]|nr:PAS domain S-box protein [Leptolyngbya sp. SIO1E4]